MCLAQIYLMQENTTGLTEILKSVTSEFRTIPNMLSSLVTIYEKANDIDNAIKVLDESLLNVVWSSLHKQHHKHTWLHLLIIFIFVI